MEFEHARAEASTLRESIERNRTSYYVHSVSLVSDAEFDAQLRRLEALEQAFPQLRSDDSPTQVVGASVATAGFPPHEHAERMLSLDNVFTLDELREWAEKTRDAAARPVRWLSELKLDGLAI
ncbi:MAG TPA: NAD-dependent DNA ligase LigA, partial [Microbacteriaceae bacterium]|nr:NAD-dependent DNA ligase LigA [Microbacteriaceae bacterium]